MQWKSEKLRKFSRTGCVIWFKQKMVKDMKQISQNNIPLELYKMPVMIFGGGNAGNVIIDLLTSKGIQIDFIIDDNEGLQGTCIKNVRVISFKEFIDYSKKYEEIAVILATVYGKAV